jgi:hypothetical protein
MLKRGVIAAALGTLGLFAWAGAARADDLVRLNGGKDTPTITLGGNVDADTVLTRRGGGGGGRGGHVAFRGGSRGGFRGGFAHRGFAHRGFAHRGFSRGWYGGRGWYGRGWYGRGWYGGYYPWYANYNGGWYGYPYYNGYYGNGYYGQPYCYSLTPTVSSYYNYSVVPQQLMPYSGSSGGTVVPTLPAPLPGRSVSGVPVPADGSYDYDGGPIVPVPLPKVGPAPAVVPPTGGPAPAATVRQVSTPAPQAPRFAYPAYGDRPQTNPPSRSRIYVTFVPGGTR